MAIKEIIKMSPNKKSNKLHKNDASIPKKTNTNTSRNSNSNTNTNINLNLNPNIITNISTKVSESIFKNDNLKNEFIKYRNEKQFDFDAPNSEKENECIESNLYTYGNLNSDGLDFEMQDYWLIENHVENLNNSDRVMIAETDNKFSNERMTNNEYNENGHEYNENGYNYNKKIQDKNRYPFEERIVTDITKTASIVDLQNSIKFPQALSNVKRKVGRPKGSTKKNKINNLKNKNESIMHGNSLTINNEVEVISKERDKIQGTRTCMKNTYHEQSLGFIKETKNKNAPIHQSMRYSGTDDHIPSNFTHENRYHYSSSSPRNMNKNYFYKEKNVFHDQNYLESVKYDEDEKNIFKKKGKNRNTHQPPNYTNASEQPRNVQYQNNNNKNYANNMELQHINNEKTNYFNPYVDNAQNNLQYINQGLNPYYQIKNVDYEYNQREQYSSTAPAIATLRNETFTDANNSFANFNNFNNNSCFTKKRNAFSNIYENRAFDNANEMEGIKYDQFTQMGHNNDYKYMNKEMHNNHIEVHRNSADNKRKKYQLYQTANRTNLNHTYLNLSSLKPFIQNENAYNKMNEKKMYAYDKDVSRENINNNKPKSFYFDKNNQISSNFFTNKNQHENTEFLNQNESLRKILTEPMISKDKHILENILNQNSKEVTEFNYINDAEFNLDILENKYFIKNIPISQIKYAPDLKYEQDIDKFLFGINNFNQFLSIDGLKQEFSLILYDIFIFSYKNGGFFSKNVQKNLKDSFSVEYKFYKELYIKYLLPFEQFWMQKPVIYIFEKKTDVKNTIEDNIKQNIASIQNTFTKNEKITSEMIVETLKIGSISNLLYVLNLLSFKGTERCVITELLIVLSICHSKIHEKYTQAELKREPESEPKPENNEFIKKTTFNTYRFDYLPKEKVYMIRDQCLKIVLTYIKDNVFESKMFAETKKKITLLEIKPESFDVFINYANIHLLIKILYERSIETSNINTNLSVNVSFSGFYMIYNKFGFLLRPNAFIFKFFNKFFTTDMLQVLTMINHLKTSNKKKKKFNRMQRKHFTGILNDFNKCLELQEPVENILLLDLIINFVSSINMYKPLLAKISVNIIKYKIDMSKKEISSCVDQGLLDIFKCICKRKILESIVDFDLLMKAITLKEYDAVVKDFILNNEAINKGQEY